MIAHRRSPLAAAWEGRLLFISAVAIATLTAICAMAVGLEVAMTRSNPPATARTVSESTVLTATRGKMVYSDNFRFPKGWSHLIRDSSDVSWTYSSSGYEVNATGSFIWPRRAPYDAPLQQLSMTLTARESADTPRDAGFGVTCWRGAGEALMRYEIFVTGTQWWVLRRDAMATYPYILKEGSSPATAGPNPVTVVGMCATLADGVSTRIVMFVNGSSVADLTDLTTGLPSDGWRAGVVVASLDKAPSRVTMTKFIERNVAA